MSESAAEYSTDYSFNVQRGNGGWVSVRPNANAPHCKTNSDASAAAEYWASVNRKKWSDTTGIVANP